MPYYRIVIIIQQQETRRVGCRNQYALMTCINGMLMDNERQQTRTTVSIISIVYEDLFTVMFGVF